MPNYSISGLRVSSEIDLHGAILDASPSTDFAVSIRRAPVPTQLNDATATGPTWDMTADAFLLRVPRLARLLITSGRDIAVELEPDATERDASSFVLGAAFGILLHQRGALVLHGAAVANGGRAIAICGRSGAGKSTLAAALCRDGCSFVADDICVITLDEQLRPVVLPDGRQMKLWKESIDKLGLAPRQGSPVRETFEKYFIDSSSSNATPHGLSAIYVLREARPPLDACIESLALPDAMRMLDYQAYRPKFRARIGQKPDMLARSAATLNHAKVFQLIRPRGFEHMDETIALLRAHWEALV
ncbi:MAG: hypothetical protein WCA78_01280 [Rhizomicrobium sp.]